MAQHASTSTQSSHRRPSTSPQQASKPFVRVNGARASLQAAFASEQAQPSGDSARVSSPSATHTSSRRANRLQRWVQEQANLGDEHDPRVPSSAPPHGTRPNAYLAYPHLNTSSSSSSNARPRDSDANSANSFVIVENGERVINLGEESRAAPRATASTPSSTMSGEPAKHKHRSFNILRSRALSFAPRSLSRAPVVTASISIHTPDRTPSPSPTDTRPTMPIPSSQPSSSRFLKPFAINRRGRGSEPSTPGSVSPAGDSRSSFFSPSNTGPSSRGSLEGSSNPSLPPTPPNATLYKRKGPSLTSVPQSPGSDTRTLITNKAPDTPPTVRDSTITRSSRPSILAAFPAPPQSTYLVQTPPSESRIMSGRASYGASEAPPRPSTSSQCTMSTAPSGLSSSATVLSAGSIGTIGTLPTVASGSSTSSNADEVTRSRTPRRSRQLAKPPSLWTLPTNASHMHDQPGCTTTLARAASPVRIPIAPRGIQLGVGNEDGSVRIIKPPSRRRSNRRTLVISGVAPGDATKEAGVRRWCETFGELSSMSRADNGDLYIQFKSAEVAETVCRIRARVTITGVGSVSLSWFKGRGP